MLLVLALACAHSGARSREVLVEPIRELQACVLLQPAEEVRRPFAGVGLDETADPKTAGFAQLLRFRLDPSGRAGRAVVVRMSNPSSGDSLFRGEKRVWAASFETDDARVAGVVYSYPSSSRPDDLWVRRSREHSVVRSGLPQVDHAAPLERACDVIQRAFPGERVVLDERSAGRVQSRGELSRFLTHDASSQGVRDRRIRGR